MEDKLIREALKILEDNALYVRYEHISHTEPKYRIRSRYKEEKMTTPLEFRYLLNFQSGNITITLKASLSLTDLSIRICSGGDDLEERLQGELAKEACKTFNKVTDLHRKRKNEEKNRTVNNLLRKLKNVRA